MARSLKRHNEAHVYDVRPPKDHRAVNLISDVLPFGGLWYGEPNAISNAIAYAKFYTRSHDAVIRVFDETGNVIETHEQVGRVQRVVSCFVGAGVALGIVDHLRCGGLVNPAAAVSIQFDACSRTR
jgi:hypothetical protein